ncbi:hypothetical protein CPC08DRAFT_824553 [Agrocybe pediades]|nr:hypothetical protein CPC08DRAFT_824553 [Agrocybe pediades]
MLILASILLSRSSNTNGSFSSIPDAVFFPSFPRDADPTLPCPRQRIQIIWACVATILTASWVSVHPNIPNPKEPTVRKTLRRIELMTWAIMTPELIIFWALRQWHGARSMEREFAEYQHRESEDTEPSPIASKTQNKLRTVEWTRTHGFFLQMGGFMLREEGKEDRVLGWRTLMEYYKEGRLDLLGVTEDRINDQSKTDGFAKGLALLQMFWFITQCIARFFYKNLVLTQLELATAGLALLSLVMYSLWWNKPFNARVPITITLLRGDSDTGSELLNKAFLRQLRDSIDGSPPYIDDADILPIPCYAEEATPVIEISPHPHQSGSGNPTASCPGSAEVDSVAFARPPKPQSVQSRVQFVSGSQPAGRPPQPPTIESAKSSGGFQLWFLFMRIDEILLHINANAFDNPDDAAVTCVPSFYSVRVYSNAALLQMLLTSFSAAALFGFIHCIGWSSKIVFTSHAALLAWRMASAVITACPVVWCLTFAFSYTHKYFNGKCGIGHVVEKMLEYLNLLGLAVSVAVTIPAYLLARLALLLLAFIELRDLPPGALASIHWANVLPFIH